MRVKALDSSHTPSVEQLSPQGVSQPPQAYVLLSRVSQPSVPKGSLSL